MLCIDDDRLIIPHQTHEDRIRLVDETFLSLETSEKKDLLEGIDAVITRVPRVCIGVSTADCIPVLLYDKVHRAVAAIHSGWRGTVKRISQKTLVAMQESFSTRAEDVVAVIGPGISVEHFEVGDEVYNAFADAGFDMSGMARKYEKWHLDLWEANRQLLVESGIPEKNIHIERICTYAENDVLFSARREQTGSEKCGRNFNAVMITPD